MDREQAGDETLQSARTGRSRTGTGAGTKAAANGTAAAQAARGNRQPRRPPGRPPAGLYKPVEADTDDRGELSPRFQADRELPRLYDPGVGQRNRTAAHRLGIALFSTSLLAFVVVAAFVTLWKGGNIDNLTRLLDVIFAPLVALVAAAVAFYYRGSPPK